MTFYVYLLLSVNCKKNHTYVGYTKNLNRRLFLHNTSKGAKFTRGRKWKLIYKKKFGSKSIAMKEEHKLKKNYVKRKMIKEKFINK
ncbi:GIY-YIG nuclease family protein [Candidatus Pelagibacter sp.]|nr:GIY-YIG nuclease family protein [Candidatus Pelagibacter sp.]MDC0465524.1 GIY-YIG nuclease family protein [Candidatus Pelagibacter sp.]